MSPTLVVSGNYNKTFGQDYDIKPYDFTHAHPTPLRSVLDMKGLPDTVVTNRYRRFVQANREQEKKTDSLLRINLKKLLDGGVTIATGTDAGNIGTQHVSSYFDELAALQQSGLDAWQLLQASTINGAKLIAKEAETGSVKRGKRADLLLLKANPLDSLANWRKIDWVINKGKAVKPDSFYKLTPEELADAQLLAYNAHHLEAFLVPYAEEVEIYSFPVQLDIKGKEAMRKAYHFITTTPGLYCRLLNRMVQGNTIVDHQEVWGFGNKPFYGIAIYEVKDGKIKKVFFPK